MCLSPSVGQTPCREGDQTCLYNSCLDSCGGSSLCDPNTGLSNCSKYSSWRMQSPGRVCILLFSFALTLKCWSLEALQKYMYLFSFSFFFFKSLHVVAEKKWNGLNELKSRTNVSLWMGYKSALLNIITITFNSMLAPIYYFLGSVCRQMLSFFLFKAQLQKWELHPRGKCEVHLNSHIKLWLSVLLIKFIPTFPGTLLTEYDLAAFLLMGFGDNVTALSGVKRGIIREGRMGTCSGGPCRRWWETAKETENLERFWLWYSLLSVGKQVTL